MPPSDDLDGQVLLGADDFEQSIERRFRLQNLAFDLVSANDYTSGAVSLVVAAVDENAYEMLYVVEVWELSLEPWTVLHRYLVGPCGDGGFGIDLLLAGTRDTSRSVRAGGRQFPNHILDGVTEIHTIDVEFADGVGRTFEDAFNL